MSMRGWVASGLVAAALLVTPSARADESTQAASTTGPWVVTAVGGALVVGGLTAVTVNTVNFASDKDDLQAKKVACAGNTTCSNGVDSQYNDLTTASTRRNFLFGVVTAAGALTATIGIVMLVNANNANAKKASITLVPSVGKEMNGAALVGRF